MLRGSLLSPFLTASKSTDDPPPQERPQSANPCRMSSSSVFPVLRRLETSSSDMSPLPSRFSMQSAPSIMSSEAGASISSSSRRGGKDSALISLKFTGPSFLDVVIKDNDTKDALYIIETVRDDTTVYRLDAQSRQGIPTATVKWPQSLVKGKGKSGRTVKIGDGRWRDAEEFLKYGALGNYATRKFNIPHFPHALKWKMVPGNTYYCSTSGIKGPIAVLDAAVLSAPPRLRLFQTFLNGDDERTQQNYRGVPVMLLDYLVITALLMVTEVQEWLDRPQTDTGRVRIPGSSASAVQKWLAIIHGEPIPTSPTTASYARTTASSDWDARSRLSGASGSVAGSSSSDPMTPFTPATSFHSSFFTPRDEDVPPVPPLPKAVAQSRPQTFSAPHPYTAMAPATSSSPPPPSLPTFPQAVSSAAMSTKIGGSIPPMPSSPSVMRPLPRPPTTPSLASLRRPYTSDGSVTPSSTSTSSFSRATSLSVQRPESPSVQSTASSSTSSSRRSRLGRSLTVVNMPPQQPPPMASLPLPPKLAQELSGSQYDQYNRHQSASTNVDDHARTSNPLPQPPQPPQGYYPQFGSGESTHSGGRRDDENDGQAQIVHGMQAMALAPGTGGAGSYPGLGVPGALPMVDMGMISMGEAGSRRSYAETIYEQPPPAYDAIDFTRPQVHIAPHTHMQQR